MDMPNLIKAVTGVTKSAHASVITLLDGISAQVAACPPTPQAIAALAVQIKTETAALADAVVVNTPAQGS